jgi:lysophospholipase L1-like esterase
MFGGARLSDCALFYPKTQNNVKVVIQTLYIPYLTELKKSDPTLVAFSMYNYTIDDELKSILSEQFYAKLTEPKIIMGYEARGIIKRGTQQTINGFLDKYITLANRQYNPLKSNNYDELIGRKNSVNPLKNYKIDSECASIILKAHEYFEKRSIRYVLIIDPVNPDITSSSEAEIEAAVKAVKDSFNGIDILDSYHLLNAEDFFDDVHLNSKGQEKWSLQIGEYVSEILAHKE